ncbi:MAG: SpoIVB peptidase S55 domain-containing protein [Clostridia bacterium]
MSNLTKNKKKLIIICTMVLIIITIMSIFFEKSKDAVTCSKECAEYVLGGEAVGIKLLASGVLVMGIDRTDTDLKIGDIILEVNGCKIETNVELEEYAELGQKLDFTVQRNDKKIHIEMEPKLSDSIGEYRLGLWVKDSSAGVGTITFYERNTSKFAALGHAITETSNQNILPITTGGITRTEIYMIKKGISKIPGELKGTLTNETLGQICTNTQNGVFGYIENNELYNKNDVIEIGTKEEIETKEAYIYVTLDDNVKKKYKIEIEKVYLNSTDNKNIAIRINDEELINKTGGIVQGMSGAPIVQNGKLIGCITHVLLDDPTRGYGAFIENMINDMENI